MKKILAFILAAVLAVSFVGCGGNKGKEASPKNNNDIAAESGANVDEENSGNVAAVDGQNGETQNDQTTPGSTSDTVPTDDPDNAADNKEGTDANEGSDADDNKTDDPSKNDAEKAADDSNGDNTTEKDTDKQMPADETKPADEQKPADNPVSDNGSEVALPSVSKQTPVDTDMCRFTVTGIKEDSFIGPTLLCELENKSKDVNYIFNIKDSYVNGVYTPMYLYSEVAAGKKTNVEVSLSTDEMRKYGLTKITDIEITLEVKDSNSSWIDPPAVLQTFNIQPYGKGQAKKFSVGNDVVKNVYIDNKYAKVSALNYYFNDMYGYCIDLFIENKSNANISVKFENTSVNGKLLDPYVYEVVNQGKSVIARVDWPTSDFEENGFTTFEEIKFTLVIANNDDVSSKSYSSDEIVLTFGG